MKNFVCTRMKYQWVTAISPSSCENQNGYIRIMLGNSASLFSPREHFLLSPSSVMQRLCYQHASSLSPGKARAQSTMRFRLGPSPPSDRIMHKATLHESTSQVTMRGANQKAPGLYLCQEPIPSRLWVLSQTSITTICTL